MRQGYPPSFAKSAEKPRPPRPPDSHTRGMPSLRTPAPSDAALVNRYVRGRDHAAFTELTRRLGPLVWSLAVRNTRHREDAEDVLQLVFAELARRAGTIAEPAAVAGWLHTLTVRTASAVRRRRTPRPGLPYEPVDASSLDAVGGQAELDALSEELDRLPTAWREPLLLRYFGGLTNEEAADRLGTTVAALEGRLKRGKNTLRVRLLKRGVGVAGVLAAVSKSVSIAAAAGSEADWPDLADAAATLATDADPVTLTTAPPATTAGSGASKAALLTTAAAAVLLSLSGGPSNPAVGTALPISTVAAAQEDADAGGPEAAVGLSDADGTEAKEPAESRNSFNFEFWASSGRTAEDHFRPILARLNEELPAADFRFGGLDETGDADILHRGGKAATFALVTRATASLVEHWEVMSDDQHLRCAAGLERLIAQGEAADLPERFRPYLAEAQELRAEVRRRFQPFSLHLHTAANSDGLEVMLDTMTMRAADAEGSNAVRVNDWPSFVRFLEVLRSEPRAELSLNVSPDGSVQLEAVPIRKSEVAEPPPPSTVRDLLTQAASDADLRVVVDPDVSNVVEAAANSFDSAALDEVLESIVEGGVDFVRDGDRLRVTTPDAAARVLFTRRYPLPDALHPAEATGVIESHAASPRRGPVYWSESVGGDGRPIPGGAVTAVGETVLVTQSDRGHAAVAELLRLLNDGRTTERVGTAAKDDSLDGDLWKASLLTYAEQITGRFAVDVKIDVNSLASVGIDPAAPRIEQQVGRSLASALTHLVRAYEGRVEVVFGRDEVLSIQAGSPPSSTSNSSGVPPREPAKDGDGTF